MEKLVISDMQDIPCGLPNVTSKKVKSGFLPPPSIVLTKKYNIEFQMCFFGKVESEKRLPRKYKKKLKKIFNIV